MKILNLYSGIGGNRKLWPKEMGGAKVEVTAVELNPEIAKIYHDFFPEDKVIVGDAHQYLLEHYNEFDFIWSSPPCPTHSRMRFLKMQQGHKPAYPDIRLYQEVIFLQTWFKGKFCVENVISYYTPLVRPQISNNHYFWCNFKIDYMKKDKRDIRGNRPDTFDYKEKRNKFDLINYKLGNRKKRTLLSNCVKPELGLEILECSISEKQMVLA